MKIYLKKEIDVEVIARCDVCNKILDDDIARQECLSFYHDCGYGSIFGDGTGYTIDMCQECVKKVLGDCLVFLT